MMRASAAEPPELGKPLPLLEPSFLELGRPHRW